MLYFVKLYAIALAAFLAIDLSWLGWLARGFYQQQLGDFLAVKTNWAAAFIFYLIFIGGLLYFSVLPALREENLAAAILNGAFFGLVTYATYELTNLATHRDWPLLLVLVDIGWGIILCLLVSVIVFFAGKWLA